MTKTLHCCRYGVNIPRRMLGVVLCLSGLCSVAAARPRERLPVRLDPRGPYLILETENAARAYGDAVAKAKALHPAAAEAAFAPERLDSAKSVLLKHRPRYVLLFMLPDELDVNFAWQWLTLCTEVGDGPLPAVRTGFITGQTPA